MLLFSKNRKPHSRSIIVGCGRLGAKLANTLSDAGEDVIVIDQNMESFRKLPPTFGGLFVTGDATDTAILEEAQIDHATAVILVTDDDNTNILVAQIAKEVFHTKTVIARLYDSERECVYREFGIDTICPAALSAREVNRLMHIPHLATVGGEAV